MTRRKCCNNKCKTLEEFLMNHMPLDGGLPMMPAWAHACDDPDCILCDKGMTADLG